MRMTVIDSFLQFCLPARLSGPGTFRLSARQVPRPRHFSVHFAPSLHLLLRTLIDASAPSSSFRSEYVRLNLHRLRLKTLDFCHLAFLVSLAFSPAPSNPSVFALASFDWLFASECPLRNMQCDDRIRPSPPDLPNPHFHLAWQQRLVTFCSPPLLGFFGHLLSLSMHTWLPIHRYNFYYNSIRPTAALNFIQPG